MRNSILIAAALMITLSAAAQPGDQNKAFPGPPGGFPPQGMGPGGFPGGSPGMGPQSGRPPMMGGEIDIKEIEKYNQKQEKKLKKILGDNLYTQWRSKHPMEAPKLPDIKLQ